MTTAASPVAEGRTWPTDHQSLGGIRPRVTLPATLVLSGVVFGMWALISVLVPLIAGRSAEEVTYGTRLVPPSTAYLMGTDALGRDVLVRTAGAFPLYTAIGAGGVLAPAALC